ncbi:DUF2690 domain-containing protein, partial [Pseudonocardia acidicola]
TPDPAPRRRPRWPGWPGWVAAAVAACAAAAVLAGPPGVLGAAAPASTEPPPYTVGCRGTQCAGGEAEGMGCGIDAATFAELRVGSADLELRISDQCAAAWARISHSAAGDRVIVMDQDGHSQAATVPDTAAAEHYVPTSMIAADAHSHVRACVQSRDHGNQCTPWGAESPVPLNLPTPPPSLRVSTGG